MKRIVAAVALAIPVLAYGQTRYFPGGAAPRQFPSEPPKVTEPRIEKTVVPATGSMPVKTAPTTGTMPITPAPVIGSMRIEPLPDIWTQETCRLGLEDKVICALRGY